MPWRNGDYPPAMKNMPIKVRNKAVEIANALYDEGEMEEGVLIATAIKRSKEWAESRGINTESKKSKSKSKQE